LDLSLPPFWKFPNTLPDNLIKTSKSGKKEKREKAKARQQGARKSKAKN